jgi:hypothetical protein
MANALDRVEEAVALLREAGAPALARHWTGSVPFAFGALAFWQTVTGYRVSDVACAGAALGLTLLLVWMSCWRAAFAVELLRRLHGASAPARPLEVARNQAAAAGFKLLAVPIAAAALVPLPWMVAFFRGFAAFSDLEAAEAWRRARRFASFEIRANWVALGILTLVGLAVFLNVVLALALLPQLLKAITGHESEFAKVGPAFLLNRLFFLAAALIAWVAVDPLVQAFYCVQTFRAESVTTGADVRARLRMARRAAESAAPLLLLLLGLGAPMAAAVTAPELEGSIEKALRSSEYDWRLPRQAAGGSEKPWLVSFTERVVNEARRFLRAVARLLDRIAHWLLDRRPSIPREGAPPASLLGGGLWFLIAAAALAGLGLLWKLRRRAPKEADASAAPLPAVDLSDEGLTADRLPEERWRALGDACLARGDYRAALRAYYLANLAWLGSLRLISLHPGKTNREYEREMRRRGRATADAPPLLAANIDAFERCWYGRREAGAGDVDALRERLRRMKELLA